MKIEKVKGKAKQGRTKTQKVQTEYNQIVISRNKLAKFPLSRDKVGDIGKSREVFPQRRLEKV